MERPIFKPVGTPIEQLDTPALVVDLPTMEQNIETLHAFFRQRDTKLRPHIESHRCPIIAHKQLAAGGGHQRPAAPSQGDTRRAGDQPAQKNPAHLCERRHPCAGPADDWPGGSSFRGDLWRGRV